MGEHSGHRRHRGDLTVILAFTNPEACEGRGDRPTLGVRRRGRTEKSRDDGRIVGDGRLAEGPKAGNSR